MITVHNGETELRIQLPSSHPLTAPVHPPERVTGPPELHHSKGRYLAGSLYTRIVGAAVMRLFIAKELNDIFLHREIIKMASETGLTSENQDNTLSG